MKNAIVFLLFLVKIGVTTAQYNLVLTGTTAPYTCTITNIDTWADKDLLTWIFPDGQYMKREMTWNGMTSMWVGNTVQWTPTSSLDPNADGILAYLTKKGGTGNPALVSNNTTTWAPTTNPPAAFYFPPGKSWQVNRTWEFSPGNDTYLFISYKQPSEGCPLSSVYNFEVTLPPEISLSDYIAFNNEDVNAISAAKIKIDNLSSPSSNYRHVFLKLHTAPQADIGKSIEIKVKSNLCSTVTDSITLSYVTSGVPHDPNKKTVDINRICAGQNEPAKLTYTIQFHNDGSGPVDHVDVTDNLPVELNPATFELTSVPMLNGIIDHTTSLSSPDPIKKISFYGPGLPGFNQTNPSYSYDQTIYRFSFEVFTVNSPENQIENKANIQFFDGNVPLNAVSTNIAKTSIDGRPPDCFSLGTEASDLLQNVAIKPNPFLDKIDFSFELLEKSRINVEVRDIWGRWIATIASGEHAAGAQNFSWDGADIPEGVYLIFLRTEKGAITKRIIKV